MTSDIMPDEIWAIKGESITLTGSWSENFLPRAKTYTRTDTIPQWQTIDSAPRDGTDILITNGTDTEVCYWRSYQRVEGGEWQGNYYDGYDFNYVHKKPTHWMKLPAPPIDEK